MTTWWLEKDDEWTLDKILEYVKQYEVVHVGCDSKYYSRGTKFAIAIGVYQNPCVTYWYSKSTDRSMKRDIKQRLMAEVEKAIEVGWAIREKLPDIKIVIHCDINSDDNFPSSCLDQFSRGYVTGCGFEYVNKPNAWCASGCADYHTR